MNYAARYVDNGALPNYWSNGTFENLKCPYYGPDNGSHWVDMWNSKVLGHEMELLSHVCVNGSFAHLSIEEWNQRCFPTYKENVTLSRITGVWSLINFLLGVTTNLLTLLAIPYAYYKRRHGFHRTFWKTDVWILHLAFCEFLYCIVFHPHFFVPSLGGRYPQGIGTWFCTASFLLTILTYTNDWLLVAIVAVTRVLSVKWPNWWTDFCDKKVNVFLVMASTWIFQALLMSPIFIQPSRDMGYNCLMGKCNYIPTGRDSIAALDRYVDKPVFIGRPFMAAFLIPCLMTGISYVIIWKHMKDVKQQASEMKIGMGEGDKSGPKMLSKTEISFIWTVFIICLCYFLCAIPGVLLCDILGMGGDPIIFLVALTFVWLQFTMNIFIYSYRVKKYKLAYLDFIALVFPCMSNLVQKMKGDTSTQNTTTNATANITSIASASKT